MLYIIDRDLLEDFIMKKVQLKSSAIIKLDELNNVWYSSDVEVVLGKVEKNGKFNPYNNNLFTAEMLNAIATLMKDGQESPKN